VSVVVAVAIEPFPYVFEMDSPPAAAATWAELPQATIDATPEDSLRDVLGRACGPLGVRLPAEFLELGRRLALSDGQPEPSEDPADHLVFLALRQEDDDELLRGPGYEVRRRLARMKQIEVVVRDANGHAVWKRPGLDATMGELIDARAAGLLRGDPRQPYLIPSVPQGDFFGLDWPTFKDLLTALGVLATSVATTEGVLEFKDRLVALRKRRKNVVPVVEAHQAMWQTRGAAPGDLLDMLRLRPRSSEEVSALLGCSTSEAEALLWGLGFAHDDSSDLWVYAGDELAKLLAADLELGLVGLTGEPDDRSLQRQIAEDRLLRFLESGTAPDPESSRRALGNDPGPDAD
jgi:hypothetical protein